MRSSIFVNRKCATGHGRGGAGPVDAAAAQGWPVFVLCVARADAGPTKDADSACRG